MGTTSTLGHGQPLPGQAGDDRIGPYVLLERLGEGGMGEVWLAQQTAPIQRQVALKLIRAGLDSRRVASRFEVERQALALMEHPAIARVFDGGQTAQGRPWFAMELVRGVPLHQHCDAERLTTRERLALFAQVCAGVQHAHQKAIIHRDLKPSNVLVATVDGKAQPKIIDFGIAKATDRRFADGALSTEAGALVGTPEYMSPEQADPSCEDVDTRADVYSLGVLLYELLSGALPFSSQLVRGKSHDELRRLLREVDPPAPSQRLLTMGAGAAAVGERRRTLPEALRRELSGDLDAITMRAMEKERGRRYASVGDLWADVERFLRNEPVLARPASAAYRLLKYARRHRTGVAVAAVLALILPAFIVGLAVQVRRVSLERDRANREAAVAERVVAFMTGMFDVSDPREARGNSIRAREVLDRASGQIERDLTAEPVVQARLMYAMGNVYERLGLSREALPLAQRSRELRTRMLGAEAADTLLSSELVAEVLESLGRFPEAETLARDSLQIGRRALGEGHEATLRTQATLAHAVLALGRAAEAEPLFREVLAKRRPLLGDAHVDTMSAAVGLGTALARLRRYQEAATLIEEFLGVARRTLPADHPTVNTMLGNLSNLYFRLGRVPDAIPLNQQALASNQRIYGPDHEQVLLNKNNLAILYSQARRFDEAEVLLREIEASFLRQLGKDHPNVGQTHYNLACLAALRGDHERALRLLGETLERQVPPDLAAHVGDDSDLAGLRSDPRFAAIAARFKERAQ